MHVTISSSFMILTWIAIALLTLGLIGCLRNLQLLSKSIEDRLQSPARPKPGDTVRLPPQLASEIENGRDVLLLFVQAECSSCLRALNAILEPVSATRATLMVLWKGDRHPDYATVGMPFSTEAFSALNVALTPFGLLVHDSKIIVSSTLGSADSVEKLLKIVDQRDVDQVLRLPSKVE